MLSRCLVVFDVLKVQQIMLCSSPKKQAHNDRNSKWFKLSMRPKVNVGYWQLHCFVVWGRLARDSFYASVGRVIIGKHMVACVCQVMLASMPTPPVAARWSKFFMNLCYWEPLILVHNLCQTNMQFAFDPQALERFYGVHQDRHESLAVVDLLGSALDDPEGAVDHFVVFP